MSQADSNTGGPVSTEKASDFVVPADSIRVDERSIRPLQAELRQAFVAVPVEVGLRTALAKVGAHFEGVYVGFDAKTARGEVAVDWAWEGFASVEGLQDALARCLPAVRETGASRWMPLGDGAATLLTVPVCAPDGQAVGTASAVVAGCSGEGASRLVVAFEGAMGYLALLVFQASASTDNLERLPIPAAEGGSAKDPLFLVYALVAQLRNRYGLEQVLFGFVRRGRVRVVAVSGVDATRASNPGVKRAAAAMEECLDRGAAIACDGHEGREDNRLHAQWRHSAGGGAVASLPVMAGASIQAVVGIRAQGERSFSPSDLEAMRAELQSFAWFLPVAERAHRSLLGHALESGGAAMGRVFGPVHWRSRCAALLFALVMLWCVFGTLPFNFTVPCTVLPIEPRTIACPHDGVLREVIVQVGETVKEGQLLALLDDDEARWEEAVLVADLARLTAQLDEARAANQHGEVRVLSAQRRVLEARLELSHRRVQDCRIVAPKAGRILSGEMRPRVGARLARGDALFVMASPDEVRVEILIPESRVAAAQACSSTIFAPTARPSARVQLDGLRVLPASSAGEGANIFRGRSDPIRVPEGVLPGMEGMVYLEVGDRPVWWILTHHITDWLRLRFWL